jgi:putative DNA primase/helicase
MRALNPANLPQDLKASSRWVVWKLEEHEGRKNCKIPYSAVSGQRASSTNPDDWCSLDQAIEAQGRYNGVGLIIGPPFVAVDLDKCRDPETGVVDQWARDLIASLPATYTELSPSGRGFHLWFRGKAPKDKDGFRAPDLEVYFSKRYFTVTGDVVAGTPSEVTPLSEDQLRGLLAAVEGRRPQKKEQPAAGGAVSAPRQSEKMKLLMEGKFEEAGFGDVSAAIQSLLTLLMVQHLLDRAKVEADFKSSGLYRDFRPLGRASNWIEKWERLGKDELDKAEVQGRELLAKMRARKEKKGTPEAIGGFPLTDAGNGERLVAEHGEDLRYCHDFREWRWWDTTRWSVDRTAEIYRRAKLTVRGMIARASEIEDHDQRKALCRWSFDCESRSRLENMVAQASKEAGVATLSSDFDKSPWLFNCENGTFDLESCEFRQADKNDLLSKCSPVIFDPVAKCERFKDFLTEILPSENIRKFLQLSLGYSLSGHAWEKFVWFLIGELGDNGKTTFIEAVRHVFGEEDYAANMNFNSLLQREGQGPSGDIARLRGSRFVSACESDQGQRISAALLKRLTGGGDKITASFKYKDEFEFTPTHKLWLATNHPPQLAADDDALWRRVARVPFNVRVPVERQDPRLLDKLKAEGAGILNWMLEGWKLYRVEGLKLPDEIRETTAKYRDELDVVKDFINERTEIDPGASVPSSALYTDFKRWFEQTRGKRAQPPNQNNFSKRLTKMGFESKHSRTGNIVRGLRSVVVLRDDQASFTEEAPF